MTREYEGKTEKDAIDKAVAELALDRGEFDVEVLEESKGGLFRKGVVKIRIHLDDRFVARSETAEAVVDDAGDDDDDGYDDGMFDDEEDMQAYEKATRRAGGAVASAPAAPQEPIAPNEKEAEIIEFVAEVVRGMGYECTVALTWKEDRKIVLDVESKHTGILIGRKGKNIDALQVLANVYAGKSGSNAKVIIDAENYRSRREESLRKMALSAADQVRRTKGSKLLEPMNPFERRLIHTTLNATKDVDTKSEGDGLYKQVRVIYRG